MPATNDRQQGGNGADKNPTAAPNSSESGTVEPVETGAPTIGRDAQPEHGTIGEREDQQEGSISERALVDRIRKSDRWMICLTALGAGAAIISAIIFGWQLGEMKNATVVQRRTAQTIARAYVLYANDDISVIKNSGKYRVSLAIKNSGQTIAYSTTYWLKSEIRESGLLQKDFQNRFNDTSIESFDINPGTDWPIEREFQITADQLTAIRKGSKEIYVWVIIKYADVFSNGGADRCQWVTFLVRNGREIVPDGRWKFHAIEVNNSYAEGVPCEVGGPNGISKARSPWPVADKE